MTNIPIRSIEVFYSYAHADERLRNQLELHLSSLRREGLIVNWYDRQITAGTDWAHTIDEHLNSASVILLLVSPDFMNSDYCYGIEMQRAMERHASNSALVIPIILRPVDWRHSPFARLQALPVGARPITAWGNRDKAFFDVALGIRRAIEDFAARSSTISSAPDITRFPTKTTGYFVSLDDYLKEPSKQLRHRFPGESDFARGFVYLPETYASRMQTLLHERQRVLLVGESAAGKTVLALALGKALHDKERYSVAYKNVARAKGDEGILWHELVLTHDRPGTLYILDNCHLASEAVNEFCFQWEGKPPEHAQCILISRPGSEGAKAQFEAMRDYFEVCADETIEVYAHDIYRGMLERYAATYQQQDPARYVTLEEDSAAVLQKQHGQNLVVSKSRLDAWYTLGGRLSMVREEAVYQALTEKYLSASKVALPMLCVLRQLEIPAHNLFVETVLPEEEVRQLEQDRLLTSTTVANYGVLYDLRFHPAEAREIFKAHVYRQYGQVTSKQISEGIADVLYAYLRTRPSNYLAVYQALYADVWHQRQKGLLERFLGDRELQGCASYHFETGDIADTLRYLYRLARFETARARELLATLEHGMGLQNMCTKMAGYPLQHLGMILRYLHSVDVEMAQRVINALDSKYLAYAAKEQSLQSLFNLAQIFNIISPARCQSFLASLSLETLVGLATANNIVSMVGNLQKLDPAFQRERFVAALPIDRIVGQCVLTSFSLQRLSAVLRILNATSPEQAKTLLDGIPIVLLVQKANKSNISSIEQIIGYMQEFKYAPASIEGFIEALDVEQLLRRAETENLQHLYWFLRACQKISPAKVASVLEELTPAGLTALCRLKEIDIAGIQQFAKVLPRPFWWRFLREFSAYDIALACNRSALGTVGSFILHEYAFLERGYLLFEDLFLKERLHSEPLSEIGKFLHRLCLIPRRGIALARHALTLLSMVELADRVVNSDLEQYALLLYNAQTIGRNYPAQLLAPLYEREILQSALERSSLHGIQMLIHNVALRDDSEDVSALQALGQSLRATPLPALLAHARLKDIGRFLWNVYAYIDPLLAQEYCRLVDKQSYAGELESVTVDELSHFLWNLISISASSTLALCDDPAIKQRLIQAWKTDSGAGATLLGVLTRACPVNDWCTLLSLSSTRRQREQLTTYLSICFSEQRLYILALTLAGLRAYADHEAWTIIKHALPIEEVVRVLSLAQRAARTVPSSTLLSEIVEWLMEGMNN